MTFADMIKKSVLEEFSNDISLERILITLTIVFCLAAYIFLIYFLYTQHAFYDRSFNITLVGVAVITSGIVLALQSNFVISLGMVGALSIVRFRTAIKAPIDLLFLFWSISNGIICGAGLFFLAVILTITTSLALFLLDITPLGKANVLLVVNLKNISLESSVMECVKKYYRFPKVKTRNITFEKKASIIIELRVKEQVKLLEELELIKGVNAISLVSHNSEVNF